MEKKTLQRTVNPTTFVNAEEEGFQYALMPAKKDNQNEVDIE